MNTNIITNMEIPKSITRVDLGELYDDSESKYSFLDACEVSLACKDHRRIYAKKIQTRSVDKPRYDLQDPPKELIELMIKNLEKFKVNNSHLMWFQELSGSDSSLRIIEADMPGDKDMRSDKWVIERTNVKNILLAKPKKWKTGIVYYLFINYK